MASGEPIAEPFRPVKARIVGWFLGTVLLIVCVATPFVIGMLTTGGIGLADSVGFTLLGLAIFWFCSRQATVRAVPTSESLTVRNLFLSRELAWAEIISVRFPEGDPWAKLDLADGQTLAVMAIQRADGNRAMPEARRLAGLVAERGEADEPEARG